MHDVNNVKFTYIKCIPRDCARWHNCKQRLLATSCLSARPSPTGRMFRKSDRRVFFFRKIRLGFFLFIYFFNPLYVTIRPEPFSNFCVHSVRDMLEILPMKFPLLFSIARIGVVSGECC